MLAYIGISLLAIFALIAAIRWGTEKAGFAFPKRFWAVCFLSVVVVTMIVPRMVLGIFGLGWTLLFSFFLLFLVALWISFAFLPAQKLIMQECLVLEEVSAADESLPPAIDEDFALPANVDLFLAETIHNENMSTFTSTLQPPELETEFPQQAEQNNEHYSPSLDEALTAFVALEQQVATHFDNGESPISPESFFEQTTESYNPFEEFVREEQDTTTFESTSVETETAVNDNAVFPALVLETASLEENNTLALISSLADTLTVSTENVPVADLTIEYCNPETIIEETVNSEMLSVAFEANSPDELGMPEVQETTKDEQSEENRLLPTQEPEVEENVVGTVERSLPKSDSLEDLLDYALMQRSRKLFSEALSAIQAAVLLYGEKDLESLPYLIIELANIYKEQGNYEQAIQAFQEGQNQLTGETFTPWREQFIVSIAYLRIVRNTLIAHQQPMMPIDNIPALLKEEIEEEFAEWNRLS